MKLAEHVDTIRQKIDQAFRNRFGRMGITAKVLTSVDKIPAEYRDDRLRVENIYQVFVSETGSAADGYEKLAEEFTFTLFNRIAAMKVMEAHLLHPEIVTRRTSHGDRSFAHLLWLEQHPDGRVEELEGLVSFFEEQLGNLSQEFPLFSTQCPYHLLPTAVELNGILLAFNQVENDPQVELDIWKSDDVLGWLYESYNNYKKIAHKESGEKTEYNKVSIQSQVYTPRWVVKFLVDNSLGKLYLEMYPDSPIKEKYKIVNSPDKQTRQRKPLTEIRMIDPAPGSGNFLLYGFDLFYDLYMDQVENYGADYDEDKIPEYIIRGNLYGIDIDDRAVQLAQLGLNIKAKRKQRTAHIYYFNVVSSDFFLPDYQQVQSIFEEGGNFDSRQKKIIQDIWNDLKHAHKFGSLIRLEERLSMHLHGLQQQSGTMQLSFFTEQNLDDYQQFRVTFFANLQKAVELNATRQGVTFLNAKTRDAITFLQLLTQKYDVAVANPPYTDSADFGPELKKFVETNYREPYKFNTNLYATFIKRCCELTTEDGYMGIIHPHTFMFIKTFENVRKYLINHTHIDVMVDYGLDRVNLFGPGILLDATWYVLSRKKKESAGIYFNITANQQEKAKQGSLENAYDDVVNNRPNNRVYFLPQEKLKIIEGWPFIYWISDGFREKFKGKNIKSFFEVSEGLKTSNNIKYLRSPLEINYNIDSGYVKVFKGGPFNKWHGNLWLTIDFYNQRKNIENESSPSFSGEVNYFRKGIVCPSVGTKGPSFRFKPSDAIFSNADLGIFYRDKAEDDYFYPIAILNSKLVGYVNEMLNPTVNITVGDINRIPFVLSNVSSKTNISALARNNIEIIKQFCSYRIIETNFEHSPLTVLQDTILKERVIAYLNYENAQLTQVLLNEAIINELVFKVYDLSTADREQVEAKMGKTIGALSVMNEAKEAFVAQLQDPLPMVAGHIQNLTLTAFDEQQVDRIKEEFVSLYQTNNDLEEFCIRHQVNPINVWYWFKEANILPSGRAMEIALEFLADALRSVLMEDEDGIIPLIGLPGETRLIDRLEEHCLQKGFTSAQFLQLDGLLGRTMNDYLENYFFRHFSDHLNLFMYLPKTPFIWHLSSGPEQGFEVYIIIYKWNRDSLFKLKTFYINQRKENLEYRQLQLQESSTAQAQNEKEKIRVQLREIDEFTRKIEELIAEGYNPVLDDGVGKNIAPLQKKGLLRCEVLNKKQLEKYLNADW